MHFDLPTYIDRLRAVGEPNRLRILSLLAGGELAVGELADIMDQSQPRLSHHLKALTAAGLVERMPEGAWVFYSIPAAKDIKAFLSAVLGPLDLSIGPFAEDAHRRARIHASRMEAATSYFSEIADTWDTVRGLHSSSADIEAALQDLAGTDRFQRVVDIGTGTGRMLTLFASQAERLDGIDLSHRMLTVARANLERDGISHAYVRQGNAVALPYSAGVADLVIIHQVLHYMDEPERVIAEAGRILSPDGLLLIADFAPHTLEFLRRDHGHRRLGIRPDALTDWFSRAGLERVNIRTIEQPADVSEGLTVTLWSARRIPVSVETEEASVV